MRKLGFPAAFLACAALLGCQAFTADGPVSEPDLAQVKREPSRGMPADHVHAKAMADSQARQPQVEMASAAHILIRYAGALRTTPDVTRSKDEARKLAEQVVKKLQAGADWTATANQYTEDPSGKGQGGKLGTFPKGRMVPEFDNQVFALAPGGISGVVETGFGFHVIKREN
jgi:hypothetical protein